MKKKIITFFSIFVVSIAAFSQSKLSQVGNLSVALQSFRVASQLPTLIGHPNSAIVPSEEVLADDVRTTFLQIQKFVFGKDNLINLRACKGCQALADAGSMSVYLELSFLKTLSEKFGDDSKNIVAFILAHELSHFTYEYITVTSANHLSPNGNIPLLTKSFIDFVDLAKFAIMTPEEQQAETAKYIAMGAQAHSEVDLLGLLTLKGMNVRISADAIKYLQLEVARRAPGELAQTDFEIRLKAVTEAAANGEL